MSAIKVQGETYGDAAELVDAIGQLTAQYETMPEGQARADLLTHIERLQDTLREVAPESSEAETDTSRFSASANERKAPPSVSASDDDEPDESVGETEPVCPMCEGTGVLAVEPPPDPTRERCTDCDGWGIVYTGSRREGRNIEDCPTCQGDGFVRKQTAAAPIKVENLTRAPQPEWTEAVSSADGTGWEPPPPGTPPWEGATWDKFYGRWG